MKTLHIGGFYPCLQALTSFSAPGAEIVSLAGTSAESPLLIPRRCDSLTDTQILEQEADAVVFHLAESLLSPVASNASPPALLLSKLRQKGARIFLFTFGRDPLSDNAARDKAGLTDKTIAAFIDHVFTGSPENLSITAPSRSWSWLPAPISCLDDASLEPPAPDSRVRILYIPWQNSADEKDEISAALQSLSTSRPDIETRVVQPASISTYAELEQLMLSCNIYVEQHQRRYYGFLGLVAMSLGKVLLSGYRTGEDHLWPPLALSPAVNYEPRNLISTIEKLACQPKSLRDLSRRSLEYVRKYHSPEQVWRMMQLVLERHAGGGDSSGT